MTSGGSREGTRNRIAGEQWERKAVHNTPTGRKNGKGRKVA